MNLTPPPRGFPPAEFENRLQQFHARMRECKVDAVMLTTEANVRYFSGFNTPFWQSPTRPWFLLLPLDAKPVAIIPEIGAAGMADTWVEDIRAWPSPRPADEGVSLLRDFFQSLPKRFGRVGACLSAASYLRMPANDFARLQQFAEFTDITPALHAQCMRKSELEIAKTRYICRAASAAFARVPEYARVGMREDEICRRMTMDLLREGADAVPYLVAGAGAGGYDNIIMHPGARKIAERDILIIDTGATYDGYFCDFDRNWAFAHADAVARDAYAAVWRATEAGFNAARPGATCADLWRAMNQVMQDAGSLGNEVGRLGHGLGAELTEPPSNTPDDTTELAPGMIMTLEPGMTFAPNKQMVHEENIVITDDGAEWLSLRAPPELPVI